MMMTRQKLRELDWEVLMRSSYSPDITPSDYNLFRSLQNFLRGTTRKNFFLEKLPNSLETEDMRKIR